MRTFGAAFRGVVVGTLLAGVAGGSAGAALGGIVPSFIRWIVSPALDGDPKAIDPVEFGLGLGAVAGLLLGVIACTALAFASLRRGGRTAGPDLP